MLKSASTASLRLRNPGFTGIALPLECFTSLLNYFGCCTTFIDIISLASAECFSSLSLFTRFYPPVGKALPLWLMDYTHNLKIYRQPDTLERSSYYIGIRTISNAITRSHLARSYPGIGQKHLDPRDGYTPPSPGKIRGLINKKPPGMVTAVRVELTRGVLSIHFALFKGVPTVRYSASSHCQETISLFYS